MKCTWKLVGLDAGYPRYCCTRCNATIINRSQRTDREVLDAQPDCGQRASLAEARRKSQSKTGNKPQVRRRVVSYTRALRRWIKAGRPTRSGEEIRRIYDQLCRRCVAHFDQRRGTCRVCGCRVRRGGTVLLNKIKMATESCPRGKW